MRKFVGGAKRRMSWESFTAALLIVILFFVNMCVKRKKIQNHTNVRKNQVSQEFSFIITLYMKFKFHNL